MKRKFLIFLIIFSMNCFSRESIILKRNIFTAPPPPPPKIETPSILKPQPLPSLDSLIEILGIVYFPKGNSYVIIKDKKTNTEEIYKEQELVGQAKIIKIEKDKVYFEYDNKTISLNLENKPTETGIIISKDSLSLDEKQKVNIISPKIPEKVISMDVDFEKTIGELVNDKNLIQNVNLTPNVNEGKIEGFKVSNLPENSIPYQYGLRNGDIVKRVNGILIDSMSTAFNVYNQIKNSNVQVVTVEILRDNKPILLTFRLNR
jgi:general secretion pathway protein C